MRQRNEKGIFIEIPDDQKLDKLLTIRVHPDQKDKLIKFAKSVKRTYGDLIREFIDNLKD